MSSPATQPSLDLSIGLTDLTSSSQLKKLIQADARPIFTFATQIAPFWDSPLQNVPNGTSASITISGSGAWKTTGVGIGFSLSASAKCQLKVVTSGAVLNYAPDLQSDAIAELPAAPYPGSAYIVISLDFQLGGSISGSGNLSGVGVSGNVKGSADSSVVFCHMASGGMNLKDAIKEAFEKFVFPFEPSCATDMNAGDIAQVNFNGALAANFDVSYGIADVKFSAPGVASVLDSVTKGAAQLTLPSGKVDIGAQASISFTHSDDFTAIVQKQDAYDAFLYVMRAHKNDSSEGVKVSAAVTITNASGLTVDPQKIAQAVNGITAGLGGQAAATYANEIAQGLNGKLNSWITSTTSKGASLGAQWDQHHATSLLFKYQVNLNDTGKLASTWNALCSGNLRGAVGLGGLVPEPGSGINTQLSRSFTLSLQFFNLFAASEKTTYFKNTNLVVTQSGDLRYTFDIGKESQVDINKSRKTCLIHFVASVDANSANTVSAADVDLELELTATNNRKEAGHIGDAVGFIRPNQQVNQAQKAMQQFVAANPAGTLDLVCVLKSSAYGRLSCSEYVGRKPPANQQQDAENWQAFHDASVSLLNLQFAQSLSYQDWQQFNVLCVYGEGVSGTPDRHSEGNPAAVPPSFWGIINAPPQLISFFLLNTAEFMNLCDDLHQLAGLTAQPNTSPEDMTAYDSLLTSLVELILKRDVSTDYSKPAIGALLNLSNPQGVTSDFSSTNNSLKCTLTLT